MAKELVTIDASGMESINYSKYLANYFAAMGTTTRGATTYYGSTYFQELDGFGGDGYYDGTQVGVRYAGSTNNAQVLMEGYDMQYDGIDGIHHGSYSGAVNRVAFGTWDADTTYLGAQGDPERSTLVGVNKELVISGLDIFGEVGSGAVEDNGYYQLMTALRNANSTAADPEGSSATVGELAIQKIYQMFATAAQRFIGSEGDDTYVGTNFADKIDGGAGADKLAGGLGKDLFIFDLGHSAATAEGADLIRGFNASNQDRIDLSRIDFNSDTPDHDAFTFIGKQDFSGEAGEVRYERVDNKTHVEIFINDEVDPMTIVLNHHTKLDAADFVL